MTAAEEEHQAAVAAWHATPPPVFTPEEQALIYEYVPKIRRGEATYDDFMKAIGLDLNALPERFPA